METYLDIDRMPHLMQPEAHAMESMSGIMHPYNIPFIFWL